MITVDNVEYILNEDAFLFATFMSSDDQEN